MYRNPCSMSTGLVVVLEARLFELCLLDVFLGFLSFFNVHRHLSFIIVVVALSINVSGIVFDQNLNSRWGCVTVLQNEGEHTQHSHHSHPMERTVFHFMVQCSRSIISEPKKPCCQMPTSHMHQSRSNRENELLLNLINPMNFSPCEFDPGSISLSVLCEHWAEMTLKSFP